MWFLLALCSACLLGMYDVFKKYSLKDNAVVPVLTINCLICACIFLPLIILSATGAIGADSDLYIPSQGWNEHRLVIRKAVLVLSSWICGYFGIKHLPITIVGPINATRPVMVMLGALIIFGERLNLLQWIGVIVAILAFYLLSRSGRKEGVDFERNHWIWLVIASAVLGAASGLYDKYLVGVKDMDPLFVQGWYNVYQTIIMGIVLVGGWMPARKQTTPFQWKWTIPLISLFLTGADLFYFFALDAPGSMISVVSMVRRSSVVVSFAFGAMLFHERNLQSKAIDLALVLVSLVFLLLGTL